LGMVVGRADLDDVDAQHRQFVADPRHRIEELATRQSPWLRRTGTWRVTRVADVDVDRQEYPVAVVECDRESLVEDRAESLGHELAYVERAHVLVGHPVQRLGTGPVPAQPKLQETVATRGS